MYTFTGLEEDTPYVFYVSAETSAGEGEAAMVMGRTSEDGECVSQCVPMIVESILSIYTCHKHAILIFPPLPRLQFHLLHQSSVSQLLLPLILPSPGNHYHPVNKMESSQTTPLPTGWKARQT